MVASAGEAFQKGYSGRGLAVGDYDNDGATDLIFTSLNSRPALLHNNLGAKNSWIGFQLVWTRSTRDAIGSTLTLRAVNRTLVRWITAGPSFLSSHYQPLLFGLGILAP